MKRKNDQPQSKKNTQSLAFDIVEIKPFSPNPKPPISTLTSTKTNHQNPPNKPSNCHTVSENATTGLPTPNKPPKYTKHLTQVWGDVACTAGNPCLNARTALMECTPSTLYVPMCNRWQGKDLLVGVKLEINLLKGIIH